MGSGDAGHCCLWLALYKTRLKLMETCVSYCCDGNMSSALMVAGRGWEQSPNQRLWTSEVSWPSAWQGQCRPPGGMSGGGLVLREVP